MSDEDEVAARRDDVIRQMFKTPPKPHKSEPKRRPAPKPSVRDLPKHAPIARKKKP